MKDLSTTVFDEAIKQRENASPFIRLIEVTLPDFRCVRLANYDTTVNFEFDSDGTTPHIWQPFHLALGDFLETKRGDLPQMQLAISNVTKELMAEVDAADGLTDQAVRILMVNAATLADDSARTIFTGEIIGLEVDQQTLVFDLGKPSLNRVTFPALRVLTQCSVVTFGDTQCGYEIPDDPTDSIGGGFSHCRPRNLAACRERGDDEVARGLPRQHPRRFFGFPGVSSGNP